MRKPSPADGERWTGELTSGRARQVGRHRWPGGTADRRSVLGGSSEHLLDRGSSQGSAADAARRIVDVAIQFPWGWLTRTGSALCTRTSSPITS